LELFDGQSRPFDGGKDVLDFMDGTLSVILTAGRRKPHGWPRPSLHVRMHRRNDGTSPSLERPGYAVEKLPQIANMV
jgi:hypothetical protein